MSSICEVCTSYMTVHPTMRFWLRCNCGFCKPENCTPQQLEELLRVSQKKDEVLSEDKLLVSQAHHTEKST